MSSSSEEVIVVCQVPMCFCVGDEHLLGEHSYYFCDDHATAWGWCPNCGHFVGRHGLNEYDLCSVCAEAIGDSKEMVLARLVDEIIDESQSCPFCQSNDVTFRKTGGYCHACEQDWDDGDL